MLWAFPFERFNRFFKNMIHSKKEPAADVALGIEDIINARAVLALHCLRGCEYCRCIEALKEKDDREAGSRLLWEPSQSKKPFLLRGDRGTLAIRLTCTMERRGLFHICALDHGDFKSLYRQFQMSSSTTTAAGVSGSDNLMADGEDGHTTKVVYSVGELGRFRDFISRQLTILSVSSPHPEEDGSCQEEPPSKTSLRTVKLLVDLIHGDHVDESYAFRIVDRIMMGKVQLRASHLDQGSDTQCSFIRVADPDRSDRFFVGEIQRFIDFRAVSNDEKFVLVSCKWYVATDSSGSHNLGIFAFSRNSPVFNGQPFVQISSVENVLMVKQIDEVRQRFYVTEHSRY